MNKKIEDSLKFVEAVVELMHPFVEAAIHDIESGGIIKIYNNISKRNVGDRSPLELLNTPIDKYPDYFTPYYKENWDGKLLKCTSITIRDEKRNPIALVCFNFDTSVFRDFSLNLKKFLDVDDSSGNPLDLFEEDYKAKITKFIDEHLKEKSLHIDSLTKGQKIDLVKSLYDKGIFNYKNATVYLASLLKVSRATIYNYLKQQP